MSSPNRASREGGFTLIEMLVAMTISAVLLTLGAFGLRQYWLTQSLYGSRDDLVSELRRSQEQAVSESHPKVFGVRLLPGSSDWAEVEYDPQTPACREIQTNRFNAGVIVAPTPAPAFTSTAETTYCKANLTTIAGVAIPDAVRGASQYVWFYARGTGTAGSAQVEHPSLPGKVLTITVTPITGRVTAS
jgi:prepilin-type N-terminal cleavage/methylation domain-containing protein